MKVPSSPSRSQKSIKSVQELTIEVEEAINEANENAGFVVKGGKSVESVTSKGNKRPPNEDKKDQNENMFINLDADNIKKSPSELLFPPNNNLHKSVTFGAADVVKHQDDSRRSKFLQHVKQDLIAQRIYCLKGIERADIIR